MIWPGSLNKKIKTRVNLAGLTSFKVGGEAKFFLEAENIEELKEALAYAGRLRIPVYILGGGSNILVSDSGLRGLVIKLGAGPFGHIYKDGHSLEAGSALNLNRLVLFAKDNALSGLEFLAGLPGSLGGALAGNAGAWGKEIGGLVEEARVLDYRGNPGLLQAKELKFSYRNSSLSKYIIISARLGLRKASKRVIASRIKEYLLRRKRAQGSFRLPSAGCVFKNPGGISAGKLIDACGLKGVSIGRAVVSPEHANFVLNKGAASSKDILSLMDLMRKKVKEKFKVKLEPEIKIWR